MACLRHPFSGHLFDATALLGNMDAAKTLPTPELLDAQTDMHRK
jgi:hypothetical protein